MRLLVFSLFLLTFLPPSYPCLTKEKCIPLRAILPLLIILHHCSDFMDIPYVDADFGILEGAVVGVFSFSQAMEWSWREREKLVKVI